MAAGATFIGSGRAGLESVLRRDLKLVARRAGFEALPVPAVRDSLHLVFAKRLRAEAVLTRFNAALDQLRLQA